jgi:hypothetical protein
MLPPRFRRPFDLALIVLAAGVAFHNVFSNSFHLDDFYRIVGNPGIQQVHPFWRHFVDPSTITTLPRITNYRPLLPLTFSLNYWWGGEATAGYHAVNLAFHIVSSVLVYVLIQQLAAFPRLDSTRNAAGSVRPAALIAALLFAVHPLSGIVVNYVSARDLAMMQTFLLASLVCYVWMRARGRDVAIGWAVSLAFAALSILSKTNALALPALIAVFELTVARVPWRSVAPWRRAAIFAVVPATFFLWTRVVLRFSELEYVLGDEAGGTPAYVLAQARAHLVYLFNFAWPTNMRLMPLLVPPSHWFDPAVAAALAVLVASLFAAWRTKTSHPAIAFCLLAYWILMALESSLVPFYHLRVDYRPYPSSAFLFGALAIAAVAWLPRRAVVAASLAAVVALTAASIRINRTWRTEEAVWTHSVERGGNTVAHQSLATSIDNRRDPRIRVHLERALAIAPRNILAHVNYGLHLIELGEKGEGLAHVKQGVALGQELAQPHYWLAVAYEAVEMPGPAADEALEATALEPANLLYAYEAGRMAQNAGRFDESIVALRSVLARQERYKEAKFLEAFALQQAGALRESVAAYRRFLTWQPDHSQAHFNLAHALMTKGDCAAAIREFNRTLALRPGYREVHLYLSKCYELTGDLPRAAAERRLAER